MSKQKYALLGMIFSGILVLMGILILTGAFGGDTGYASSAPYSYDSGYASFGADFYTYVSNNAGEAASASRTAAANLHELSILLKNACGIFLMGFGALGVCFFGMKHCDCTPAAPRQEEAGQEEPEAQTPAGAESAENPQS